MNLDASAVAAQFQWLWIVVCAASLGSGALVAAIAGKQKGALAASLQGTMLSLILLAAAPTAVEQEQAAIEQQPAATEQLTDYAKLLGAELVEVHGDRGEAYIDEPNLGLISVGLGEGYLRILTGEKTGEVWHHDALVREHRLQELQQSTGEEKELEQ